MAKADLVYIECVRGICTYWHYGIDLGDDTIVHLATLPDSAEMQVQRVSRDGFAQGAVIVVDAVENALDDETVVQNCLNEVGKGGYHLIVGNCEHFARRMKTGKGESVQVDRYVSSAVRTAFSGIASTMSRYAIAASVKVATNSRFLVTAGSLIPTVVGETARHGSYALARRLKCSHETAEDSSRRIGHAATALGGFLVGGPIGSAGALAISVASDHISERLKKQWELGVVEPATKDPEQS